MKRSQTVGAKYTVKTTILQNKSLVIRKYMPNAFKLKFFFM